MCKSTSADKIRYELMERVAIKLKNQICKQEKSFIPQLKCPESPPESGMLVTFTNMDSDNDYAVAKDIVQSGQSGEDWDAFRHGKGSWPDDERKSWKQYRNYSLDKLIEMMESYKRTNGISLLNTFHPTFLPHMMAYYVRNHFLSASAAQPARPINRLPMVRKA